MLVCLDIYLSEIPVIDKVDESEEDFNFQSVGLGPTRVPDVICPSSYSRDLTYRHSYSRPWGVCSSLHPKVSQNQANLDFITLCYEHCYCCNVRRWLYAGPFN